jgi:hypothetical protein
MGSAPYAGYLELFRRFLLRHHDAPVHPREPQPAEGTARLVPARTLAFALPTRLAAEKGLAVNS